MNFSKDRARPISPGLAAYRTFLQEERPDEVLCEQVFTFGTQNDRLVRWPEDEFPCDEAEDRCQCESQLKMEDKPIFMTNQRGMSDLRIA
jgi:hypothetical protein